MVGARVIRNEVGNRVAITAGRNAARATVVGFVEGSKVGRSVSLWERNSTGNSLGSSDGTPVGRTVGVNEGKTEGSSDGTGVVGPLVGD